MKPINKQRRVLVQQRQRVNVSKPRNSTEDDLVLMATGYLVGKAIENITDSILSSSDSSSSSDVFSSGGGGDFGGGGSGGDW